MTRTLKSRKPASTAISRVASCGILVSMMYLGATSVAQAQSGDAFGAIIDQENVLFGDIEDVIVTTACLEGNPFVPDDPPASLDNTPVLGGCKLDIPEGGGTPDDDNNQLITVLPNNFGGGDLTSVRTYGSGSNTAIESDVTVDAVSKDVFFGLANPDLFDDPPAFDPNSDVTSTADVFCTSIDDGFDCARIEPCPSAGCQTPPPSFSCGELDVESDQDFCDALTGLLEGAYDLETYPLAYATSTNMTILAQPGSVTLRLCSGLQAQCLSPGAAVIQSNVRVTSVHTWAPYVETPRSARYWP